MFQQEGGKGPCFVLKQRPLYAIFPYSGAFSVIYDCFNPDSSVLHLHVQPALRLCRRLPMLMISLWGRHVTSGIMEGRSA